MTLLKKLSCATQNYTWGRKGTTSEVANLSSSGNSTFVIENDKPYAELWMGTHPNGPSRLVESGQLLSEYIKENPKVLGVHENGCLQFLFKVLSVDKALSIQSHPTKDQAKLLHTSDPFNYPDPNHKPEMTVALTPFELLCGFRPSNQIVDILESTPELADLVVDEENIDLLKSQVENDRKNALRIMFTRLMDAPKNRIRSALGTFIESIKAGNAICPLLDTDLLLRLHCQYPNDIGIFASVFLNHFTLEPTECCFLGPNEPHAYLFGDCIECMACSDNTIRAGLTPKYRDTKTLCSGLTYRMAPIDSNRFLSTQQTVHSRLYAPKMVTEFAVQTLEHLVTDTVDLPPLPSSSILLVVFGHATIKLPSETCESRADRGTVLFCPANTPLTVDIDSNWLCYRAFTPFS